MSAVADALAIALFLVLLLFAGIVVVSVVVAVAGCRMFSRDWNCLAVDASARPLALGKISCACWNQGNDSIRKNAHRGGFSSRPLC